MFGQNTTIEPWLWQSNINVLLLSTIRTSQTFKNREFMEITERVEYTANWSPLLANKGVTAD